MGYQRMHLSVPPPQAPMYAPYSAPFSPPAAFNAPIAHGYQHDYHDPTPVQIDEAYDPSIHPYWKDRVVPRPGFKSPRTLCPTADNNRIVIKDPRKSKEPPKKQLLPPRSHGITNETKNKTKNSTSHDHKASSPHSSPQDSHYKPLQASNHGLDKYAPSFVPQCLKNIQKLIHQLEPLPPVSSFPPPEYSSAFLLPHLIERRESELLSQPPTSPDHQTPLNPKHYHKHWYHILQWEVDSLCTQRSNIVLWAVKDLKLTDWKRAEFSLVVPGLRENYPRLDVGDLVKMRQVIALQSGFTEPFFGTALAFEARIIASRKREGLVHLHSPTLQEYIQNHFAGIALFLAQTEKHNPFQLPLTFNISFLVNPRPFCLMEVAVDSLDFTMNEDADEDLATRWLFPTLQNIVNRPPFWINGAKTHQDRLTWKDKDLNDEQKNAVTAITLRDWPVPFLISGPAGTGKTRTIVEAVLQILATQPDACILLCAPSNPATDTLVLRLSNFIQPSEMLRLNDQNRTFAQVPSKLLRSCYIDTTENKFSIPPWKDLMKYRVVACSCVDANILVEAQCTNRALMKMENEVFNSIHPHSTQVAAKPHWTHLIIDEATQGSEPELGIPISVVVTASQTSAKPPLGNKEEVSQPQLVLCGDLHQLGPIVSSDEARKAELDVPLLQRLFERPLYANEAATIQHFRPCAHLRKNYRSHPAILMPPSALFYNDTLVPFADNGKIAWSELPDSRLPVRIYGCETEEECIDEKSTWYNMGEIEAVTRIVKSLMKEATSCDPVLKARNIGIISPFRAQVWKLREILREANLRDVDIGTVEDWQGRENRVIIVSCVRSNARFLEDDFQKGLGLFKEPKRMNVAITRAKELLVIVGNPRLLQLDPYWKPYLQFALRNNLYEGPQLDLEVDGDYISKLEAALIHSETNVGKDADGIGIITAGIVAGEILRE